MSSANITRNFDAWYETQGPSKKDVRDDLKSFIIAEIWDGRWYGQLTFRNYESLILEGY